ncbi:hypothetical protein OROHE_002966 [Orobanche hederae]
MMKIGDKALVEMQQVKSILPSESSPQYEAFVRDLGPGFVVAKQYGGDLKNLNLASDQITALLSRCPPESPRYIFIVDLDAETRRKALLGILDENCEFVKSNSSSSIKRKKIYIKVMTTVVVAMMETSRFAFHGVVAQKLHGTGAGGSSGWTTNKVRKQIQGMKITQDLPGLLIPGLNALASCYLLSTVRVQ